MLESFRDGVEAICAALGIHSDMDALEVASTERNLLETVVYLATSVAVSVSDDIVIVPEGGKLLVYFDHDDHVHIKATELEVIERVRRQLDSLNERRIGWVPK